MARALVQEFEQPIVGGAGRSMHKEVPNRKPLCGTEFGCAVYKAISGRGLLRATQ